MPRPLVLALAALLAPLAAAQPALLSSFEMSGTSHPFDDLGLAIEAATVVPGGVVVATATADTLYVAHLTGAGVTWRRAHFIRFDGATPDLSLRALDGGIAVGLGYAGPDGYAGLDNADAEEGVYDRISGSGLRLDAEGHAVFQTVMLAGGFPPALRDAPGLPEPWEERLQGVYGIDGGWLLVTEGSLTATGPDSSEVRVGGLSVARYGDDGKRLWDTPIGAQPGLDLFLGPEVRLTPTALLVGLDTRLSAQGVTVGQVAVGAVDLETGAARAAFAPLTVSGEEAAEMAALGSDASGAPVWHTVRTSSESTTTGSRRDRRVTRTTYTQRHAVHREGAEPLAWTEETGEGVVFPHMRMCEGSGTRQLVGRWTQPAVELAIRDLTSDDPAATTPVATFPEVGRPTYVRLLACGEDGDTLWALARLQNFNTGQTSTRLIHVAP